MVGIEMEGLEDDSHVPSAKARQRVLIECAQVLARDRDGSAIRALKARHHHEQRRFARAGWSDQADCLATAYMQVDIFEDMNAGSSLPEREIDTGERNSRPRLRVNPSWDLILRHPAHMGGTPPGSSILRPGCYWHYCAWCFRPLARERPSGRSKL